MSVIDSPKSEKLIILAAYIETEINNGVDVRDLRDAIDEVRQLINDLVKERAEHNSRIAAGYILKNFDENSWFLDVLEQDTDPSSQRLLTILKKGETYEIPTISNQ